MVLFTFFWLLMPDTNLPDSCYQLFYDDPYSHEGLSCFFRYANQTGNRHEVAKALEDLARKYPDRPWIYFFLFRLQLDSGQVSSDANIRKALQLFDKQKNDLGSFYSLINWSTHLANTGEIDLAIQKLAPAQAFAARLGKDNMLWEACIKEADLLARKGEAEQAYHRVKRLEPVVFARGPEKFQKSLLLILANSSIDLNRNTRAKKYAERLIDLACETGDASMEATGLFTLLRARIEQGLTIADDIDELIDLAEQVLVTARAAGNREAESLALSTLGNLLGEGRWLEQQLELALELGMPSKIVNALIDLALHVLPDDPDLARDLSEQARSIVEVLDDDPTTAFVYGHSMAIDWQTLPWRQATALSMAALDLVESMMNLQTGQSGRAGLMSRYAVPYYRLASLLLEQAKTDPEAFDVAFAVSERIRARSLLDALDYAEVAKPLPETALLLQEQKNINRKMATELRLLQQPDLKPGIRRQALVRLNGLELDMAELDRQILSSDPAYGEARRPQLIDLQSVRHTLGPNEAMLAFQVSTEHEFLGRFEGGSWLTVATNQRVFARKLPDRRELEPVIETILTMIPNGDTPVLRQALAALHQRLFADVFDQLSPEIDHLVILPDGMLYRLPFSVLRPGKDGEPLGVAYQMEIAPSATLWHRWRNQENHNESGNALILADPVPAAGLVSGGRAVGRSWSLADGIPLQALPYARKEGNAIIRYLAGDSRIEVGEAASEHLLKTNADKFRILHFAAHAVVDHDNPERSAVVLSPGSETEDGMLQPREIAQLDLEGSIVVLSTCHSASGLLFRGEGAMSLARAFMQAGATSVIATLWPLDDRGGAEFFKTFYRHLAKGLSISEAARKTRAGLYETQKPDVWGAVVVLGNGKVQPATASKTKMYFIYAALALCAAFGVVMLNRRRKKKD